jgi:phosphoglycolate phosphatase
MKTIFWDFDGVITDSYSFVFDFWKNELKKSGQNFTKTDFEATFDGVVHPFKYLETRYGEIAEDIIKKYSQYELDSYAELVPIFPEIENAIKQISSNHESFVVSANLGEVINQTLEKNNLTNYFNEVFGREIKGSKNEKIEKICQENNYKKEECIFIGDTLSDIKQAKIAGVEQIGVTWGVHSYEKLKTENPTFLVQNIEELSKILL